MIPNKIKFSAYINQNMSFTTRETLPIAKDI